MRPQDMDGLARCIREEREKMEQVRLDTLHPEGWDRQTSAVSRSTEERRVALLTTCLVLQALENALHKAAWRL